MKNKIIVIFILIIAACSPLTITSESPTQQADATKTPKATKTPNEQSQFEALKDAVQNQTVQVWYPWVGVEAGVFESLVKKFNKTNEWGIVVIAISQNNFSYLYEMTTTSLPTAERPNLAIALPEHALKWDANSFVIDLTPYVEDISYGLALDDFPTIFLTQDKVGDRRIALPAQRSARFMLWNESWARQLGFDSAPKNPNEFREQACAAHLTMLSDAPAENDGMGGWIIDTSWQSAVSWLIGFEGGVLEQNDYRFLTPNNIEAFTFVKETSDMGCAWKPAPDANTFAAFANRQALFASISLEDFPKQTRAFADANNADNWIAIPYPQNGLIVNGSSYVMLESTPEEQFATWLFLRWMLEPEQDARMVEATHLFPIRKSSVDLLNDYMKSHPRWVKAVTLLPDATIQPQLASWREVKVMIGDGFESMFRVDMLSGRVAEILAKMESTSRELSK